MVDHDDTETVEPDEALKNLRRVEAALGILAGCLTVYILFAQAMEEDPSFMAGWRAKWRRFTEHFERARRQETELSKSRSRMLFQLYEIVPEAMNNDH